MSAVYNFSILSHVNCATSLKVFRHAFFDTKEANQSNSHQCFLPDQLHLKKEIAVYLSRYKWLIKWNHEGKWSNSKQARIAEFVLNLQLSSMEGCFDRQKSIPSKTRVSSIEDCNYCLTVLLKCIEKRPRTQKEINWKLKTVSRILHRAIITQHKNFYYYLYACTTVVFVIIYSLISIETTFNRTDLLPNDHDIFVLYKFKPLSFMFAAIFYFMDHCELMGSWKHHNDKELIL